MRTSNQLTGMDWLKQRMSMLDYQSLQEVAEDVGINRGNLYRIFMLETSPSVALLPALCRTLHTPLVELLRVLEVLGHDEPI